MKTWYDVTKEELILPSGELDQELIDKMNTIEYLEEIEDLIRQGINKDPVPAWEQLENVFLKVYMEMCRVSLGRYPEPKEIRDYLKKPEINEKRRKLLEIAMHVDEESWPEFKQKVLDEGNIDSPYSHMEFDPDFYFEPREIL